MNHSLRAFIISLVIAVLMFTLAFYVFVSGVWYGVIPLGVGLFFIFYTTIPALRSYRDEMGEFKTGDQKWLCNRCESIIKECEKLLPLGAVSCKEKIMEYIKSNSKKTSNRVFEEKNAYTLLTNTTFRFLSSGEFHLYAGELNPLGMAKSLQMVHDHCSKWLLDNKYMSQEEYDAHNKALQDNISEVG